MFSDPTYPGVSMMGQRTAAEDFIPRNGSIRPLTVSRILRAPGLAALLALAVTACVKIDPVGPDDEWKNLLGDKPMLFSSSVEKPETKADPLVNGSTFGVFAYFQEGVIGSGTHATWSDSQIPSFMYNQKVTVNGTDYDYTPVKYWPNNHENTVSFWAYSPHNPAAVFYQQGTTTPFTNTSQGLPDVGFTVTTGRDDFMTSDLVQDQYYSGTNCGPDKPGTVKFDFQHKLAWIEFKAKTAGDYSLIGQTITITSVKILKDYSSAVYRQNVSDWRDLSTERSNLNAIEVFSGNQQVGYDTAVSCSDFPALLLPQDLDHGTGNGKVTALVTYVQKQGNFEIVKTEPVTLDRSGNDVWEKNKRYVYTFSISSNDAISLIVQVQPWEHWLGTSDYTENVVVTKQLTWDTDTFVQGDGSNCTTTESITIDGETSTYKVLVLKPGTNLKGSFIFDTPYRGRWYAMLEPINGSTDGSIVFNNDSVLLDGMVGNESTIEIKAAGTATTSQYAILRFMCRTAEADPGDPTTSQTLYVNPTTIGGPFVIKQNIN